MKTLKTCGNCKTEKTLASFHKNCASKDGLTSQCKVCRSAKKKIYCAANQERIAAKNKIWWYKNHEDNLTRKKKYYDENKEAILERQKPYIKAWRKENRPHLNEYDKSYRKENKDSYDSYIKPYLRQWQKDNKDIVNAKGAEHRANKINASPSWRNKEAIKEFYKKAQRLTKETGVLHHVDHIVPLKGINVCGLHCETNLEVLTSAENLSKGNKFKEP
jgi:flagellum-specific peptidoglycan hydrolase FlgJ